jgi:hypothetical protein
MKAISTIVLCFQLSANLPRLKSRVRIPCPALKFNNFAAVVGGFFHFLALVATGCRGALGFLGARKFVHPMAIRARLEMTVKLHRQLNAGVSHLFRYVSDRSAMRQEQGSKGMSLMPLAA